MKCPKCDYLGFETGDRCRNCGYDFSLLAAPPADPVDLSLTPPDRDDVVIEELWLGPKEPGGSGSAPDQLQRVESFLLFAPAGDDEPLIKAPTEPRAPLAVRRAPELSRTRSTSRTPRSIDSGLTLQFAEDPLAGPPASESEPVLHAPAGRGRSPAPPAAAADAAAGLGSRSLAALIDHAILLSIDVVVIYGTLRMTALTIDDWRMLPPLPLLAFLGLLKFAYFSVFTAMGGQTIGKMAAGIRVVADGQFRLDPARAIRRTLLGALSLGALGLGLLPALFGPERRTLHDHVAHTRVVDLPSA